MIPKPADLSMRMMKTSCLMKIMIFLTSIFFAYCLNDPVNYYDPSGEIAVADDVLVVYAAGATATMTLIAYYTWLNSPEGKKGSRRRRQSFSKRH